MARRPRLQPDGAIHETSRAVIGEFAATGRDDLNDRHRLRPHHRRSRLQLVAVGVGADRGQTRIVARHCSQRARYSHRAALSRLHRRSSRRALRRPRRDHLVVGHLRYLAAGPIDKTKIGDRLNPLV